MKKKQTAIEWLVDRYNYVNWMRNRDEISAGTADEWRKNYLAKAKEMERQQIIDAYIDGYSAEQHNADSEQYYNKTYGTTGTTTETNS